MKIAMLLLVTLGLLAGCAGASNYPTTDPYASPDPTSRQADCLRLGGYWNPNARVCEAPLYRW